MLTKYGKIVAQALFAGGYPFSSKLNTINVMSTGGNLVSDAQYILKDAVDNLSTTAPYQLNNAGIVFGTGLLTDPSYGIYKFEGGYWIDNNNTSKVSYSSDGEGKQTISIRLTGSADTAGKVYKYFGRYHYKSSWQYFLISYYQLPEPFTLDNGETKTITLTFDVNNL